MRDQTSWKVVRKVLEKQGRKIRPIVEEALHDVEEQLGVALPESYRDFMRNVGPVGWPEEFYEPKQAAEDFLRDGDGMTPSWFFPFATDGGGNDWGFDLRSRFGDEYDVSFNDHEEPLAEDEPPATRLWGFEDWLDERLEERLSEEREKRVEFSLMEIEEAFKRHGVPTHGFAPSAADIEEAEERLGTALPRDYVAFTRTFGSVEWPVVIHDAFELERSDDLVVFGRAPGRIFGFKPPSPRVYVSKSGEPATEMKGNFCEWLTHAIDVAEDEKARSTQSDPERPTVLVRRRKKK